LQQPFGQVLESHAQRPLLVSQRPLPHAAQVTPPVPHCAADCAAKATHVLPAQQPVGHDAASHTQTPVVVLHSWPAPHAAQAAPARPHEALDSDAKGTQVLPLQQPLGHDVASHTHWPLLHSWPAAHAEHVAPAKPHEPFDSPESGSHVVPLQHPAHAPPPQVHAPLEQA
jgi:hypothetical protein